MVTKLKNKFKSEDNKRLLSNFFSLAILQGANYILPLITLPYLVRVLGVENFGLLAFAGATVAYFGVLTDYGFNLTATREISIHRENKEKVVEIFSSVMTIKFLLMFLSLFLLSILVFTFEKFSKDAIVYFLTFGTIIGQVLFPVWFFQGMERMKYITYLNILAKSIFTVAVFVFVQKQSDYWIVPLLTSIGFIVAGILSLRLIKKEFHISFEMQKYNTLKYYFEDGWHIFVANFAGNFYRNFNTIVLGLLTNNILVGFYSIAEKLIKIIQMMQNIIGSTLFPFLSKKISENKNYFYELNQKYIKYIIGIYLLAVVVTFLVAPFIVYLISGEYQANTILDLKIMSIVILIGGLNYYFGVLGLVSMGYKKEFSKAIVITGVFNIFLSIALVYFLKDVGASLSLVASESILLIIIIYFIKNIKLKRVS